METVQPAHKLLGPDLRTPEKPATVNPCDVRKLSFSVRGSGLNHGLSLPEILQNLIFSNRFLGMYSFLWNTVSKMH